MYSTVLILLCIASVIIFYAYNRGSSQNTTQQPSKPSQPTLRSVIGTIQKDQDHYVVERRSFYIATWEMVYIQPKESGTKYYLVHKDGTFYQLIELVGSPFWWDSNSRFNATGYVSSVRCEVTQENVLDNPYTYITITVIKLVYLSKL